MNTVTIPLALLKELVESSQKSAEDFAGMDMMSMAQWADGRASAFEQMLALATVANA